jgi:protein tyrosine phosphatase (PTP) superfamily phosphohydrolase (DUF442 family)
MGDTSGADSLSVRARPGFAPRRGPRRWRSPLVAALLLSVLATALTYLWWDTRRDRIRVISPGLVYQSGEFAPEDLPDAVRRLGIRTVIDLREPVEEVQGERAALAAAGIRHIHLPSGWIPEEGTVDRFLGIMRDPGTYPVLIHCKHGTGRSVLLGAIYRIEFEGWDRERARVATRSSVRWLLPGASFAVDAPKGEYLLRYAKRGQTAAEAPRAAPTTMAGSGATPATR